jgi:hypothetical protein
MSKEFIPYEEALAMKELGFDDKCLGTYIECSRGIEFRLTRYDDVGDLECKAPLHQQAFRWFREEYNLWAELIWMNVELEGFKKGTSGRVKSEKRTEFISTFNTYEEAELACLRKLIEIVNQNKDE